MGRNNIAFIIIGVLASATGITLRLLVGRNRFYRRNQSGIQEFKNYRRAVVTPFIENILTYIGWLLIIIGVVCLGAAVFVGK
ncbi:hypothetical protein [Flavobacterium sp. AG291]|uniref:hypothetical protein n=1 Tax=Flavobacterium sp. AG291 TaxID=2184000 RepID=UPI000E0B238D|nr:hypothetical protein [Flavobacterium sp. AG291]RDI11252.1 hypothetical protein DEU42_106186 [Flavobacterium sp. AG291]